VTKIVAEMVWKSIFSGQVDFSKRVVVHGEDRSPAAQKSTRYRFPEYPGRRRDELLTFGVFPKQQSNNRLAERSP